MNEDTSTCCSKKSRTRTAKQASNSGMATNAAEVQPKPSAKNVPEAQPKASAKRRRANTGSTRSASGERDRSPASEDSRSSEKPSAGSSSSYHVDDVPQAKKPRTNPKPGPASRRAQQEPQPQPPEPAAAEQAAADMVCCTPDIMELLQGGRRGSRTSADRDDSGSSSAPSSGSANSVAAVAGAQVAALARRSNVKAIRPNDFIVTQTDVRTVQPSKSQPAHTVTMQKREVVAATGCEASPVYYTINGYRIDLNTAARQESFRLPNGKFIQVKKQPNSATLLQQQPPPPPNQPPYVQLTSVRSTLQQKQAHTQLQSILPRASSAPTFRPVGGVGSSATVVTNMGGVHGPRINVVNNCIARGTTSITRIAPQQQSMTVVGQPQHSQQQQPLQSAAVAGPPPLIPRSINVQTINQPMRATVSQSQRVTNLSHEQLHQLHFQQQQQLLNTVQPPQSTATHVVRTSSVIAPQRTALRSNMVNITRTTGGLIMAPLPLQPTTTTTTVPALASTATAAAAAPAPQRPPVAAVFARVNGCRLVS